VARRQIGYLGDAVDEAYREAGTRPVEHDGVDAVSSVDEVVARAGEDRGVADIAVDDVVEIVALDGVVAGAADDGVLQPFAEDDAAGDVDLVYALAAGHRDRRAVRRRDHDDDVARRRRGGGDAIIIPIAVVIIIPTSASAWCRRVEEDTAGVGHVLQRQVGCIARGISDRGAIGIQTGDLDAVIVDLPGRNHEIEYQRIRTA